MNRAEILWVWVTELPDGGVSQVGGMIDGQHTSLSTRDERVAEALRPIARQHAERSGQRVWLRQYQVFFDHGDA